MVTPAARREAVAHLRLAYEVSERRACSALGADRTSIRYRSSRPDDAVVRARLRELAAIRRRFGYRRLHILLTREGIVMNHKKLRRLYREERLQVRRRGRRKRALGTRAPMALPQGPNQRWSLDFLSDAFSDGRRPISGGPVNTRLGRRAEKPHLETFSKSWHKSQASGPKRAPPDAPCGTPKRSG